MLNKKHLGIFLVCFGALTGVVVVAMNSLSRGLGGAFLFMLGLAVGCVLVGSILIFTRILDHYARPIVEEISEDVKDDFEDIKKRRFTGAQAMVVVTAILSFIFLLYVLKLHKFEAAWGGISVVIPTMIVLAIGIPVVTRTMWFRDQGLQTPFGIFLIPVIGMILSMLLGINNAEDIRNLSWSTTTEAAAFNQFIPSGGNFLSFTGDAVSIPDCNDDVCGAIMLVIALIVITFVLVAGSAYIPHFWFLSGFVLLTIMALITIHEIRFRPSAPETPPVRGPDFNEENLERMERFNQKLDQPGSSEFEKYERDGLD